MVGGCEIGCVEPESTGVANNGLDLFFLGGGHKRATDKDSAKSGINVRLAFSQDGCLTGRKKDWFSYCIINSCFVWSPISDESHADAPTHTLSSYHFSKKEAQNIPYFVAQSISNGITLSYNVWAYTWCKRRSFWKTGKEPSSMYRGSSMRFKGDTKKRKGSRLWFLYWWRGQEEMTEEA